MRTHQLQEATGSDVLSTSSLNAGAQPPGKRYGWLWCRASFRDRIAPWFVWSVWAAMLGGAMVFVTRYGNRVPWADEYLFLCYNYPFNLEWLWAQHAEHRVPLAKLLWAVVLEGTDFDFRVSNYLTVWAFAAAAFAMIRVAKYLRGRTSIADAFFPLALLNFGQALNYTWWWQINQSLAPLFACALLVLLVVHGAYPQTRIAILIGVILVLLAVSGPGGLPYALGLGAWLGSLAIWGRSFVKPSGAISRLTFLGLAVVAVALVGAYFINFDPQAGFDRGQGQLMDVSACALQVLSVSLGPVTQAYWPYWGGGILVLCVASLGALALVWHVHTHERWRAIGLFLFLGATLGLAVVMGWGRAGMGPGYIFVGHYLTKALPALCCVYFLWELYGGRAARLVQLGLCAAVGCLAYGNVQYGIGFGQEVRTRCQGLENDLLAGTTPFRLAGRYATSVLSNGFDDAVQMFTHLRQSGFGSFKAIQPDPPMRAINVPFMVLAVNEMAKKDGSWEGTGADPYVVLGWTEPRFIYGVQIKGRYPQFYAGIRLEFDLYWKNSSQNDFSGERLCSTFGWVNCLPTGDTHTFGVFDTVDQLRFTQKMNPTVFEILEVTLLVPEEGADLPRWAERAIDGAIVLDNDAPGYAQTGDGWHLYDGDNHGYGTSVRFAFAGAGANTARWEVGGLTAARYTVQATWTALPSRASKVSYHLYDGDKFVAAVPVDQRRLPSGPEVGGSFFQELATVQVSSGRLRVELDDNANGVVVADAVRLVLAP